MLVEDDGVEAEEDDEDVGVDEVAVEGVEGIEEDYRLVLVIENQT